MLSLRLQSSLLVILAVAFVACGDGQSGVPNDADVSSDDIADTPQVDADVPPDLALDLPDDVDEDLADSDAPTDASGLGDLGDPCERDDECLSEFCDAADGLCAVPCDPACPPGWACDAGVCGCEESTELCDGSDNDCDGLVDEGQPDRLGCGYGESCSAGRCECADPSSICDGVCENLETSRVNCGGCDIRCPGGDVCVDATCVCSGGRERCDDGCADTSSDPLHCGGCGQQCASGVCIDGICACADGDLTCPTGCTDLSADPQNCGECGVACADDEICSDGVCGCGCPGGACESESCVTVDEDSPTTLEFEFTGAPLRTDLVFNVDVTGSMGPSIATLSAEFTEQVVPAARENAQDPAFALTGFADFPCVENGAGGSSRDRPIRLYQRVTTLPDRVQTQLGAMRAGGGRDVPESGVESLFQIATGVGTNECRDGLVPPFEPEENRLEGAADGELGGVGFRAGAQPFVFQVTDAPTHSRAVEQYKFGATEEEAIAALQEAGVRVIGLMTTRDALEDLDGVITASGAAVPPCAWDGFRSSVCGPGECCTGLRTAGRAPNEAGLCPLGYRAGIGFLEGGATAEIMGDALRVLTDHVGQTAWLRAVPDEAAFELGVDTTCLVERLEIVELVTTDECQPPSSLGDADGDGAYELANGVTGSVSLAAEVDLRNECVTLPGSYQVHIELVASNGVVLGRETVQTIVR